MLCYAVLPRRPASLQAPTLTEGRGALQKALAAFLQAHPNGTVLITKLEQVGEVPC